MQMFHINITLNMLHNALILNIMALHMKIAVLRVARAVALPKGLAKAIWE